MATKAVLANRELRNKVTGIDIVVSDCEEVDQKFSLSSCQMYHVIVVTNLFYYKVRQLHKESDVVQFMLKVSYEDFEHLMSRLQSRFPSFQFPALPRKSLLVTQTLVKERIKAMDEMFKMIARTQKLCCSPMMIEFLKGKTKKPEERPVEEEIVQPEASSEQLSSMPNEFEDVDLFATNSKSMDSSYTRVSDDEDVLISHQDLRGSTVVTAGTSSIFEASDEVEVKRTDEDDLFSTVQSKKSEPGKKYNLMDDEDDLLDVDDSVDDLLRLTQSANLQTIKTVSSKPKPPQKPAHLKSTQKNGIDVGAETDDIIFKKRGNANKSIRKPDAHDTLDDVFGKKKTTGLFDADDDDDLFSSGASNNKKTVAASEMGQDDILTYIQQQTS